MPQQVMYEVEAVLSERGSGASHEYEVKWTGYAGTTWEPAASILEEVPLLVRRLHGRPPDVGMWVVIYREWPASTTDRAPEWYPGKVTRVVGYTYYVKFDHEGDEDSTPYDGADTNFWHYDMTTGRPARGDRLALYFPPPGGAGWEVGVVTRVRGDKFYVLYDGMDEEYKHAAIAKDSMWMLEAALEALRSLSNV